MSLNDRAKHVRQMLDYRNFREAVVQIEGDTVLISGKNLDEIEHDLPDATDVSLVRTGHHLTVAR